MDVDQFSAEGAAALRDAAERLGAALQRYASATAAMSGRSSEIPTVHAMNEELRRLTAEFNDRVWDQTGTVALLLEEVDDEWGDDEDDEGLPEVSSYVSVVSRWDLAVVDSEALLSAGREAHRQERPSDTEEDAAAMVSDPGRALQAILEQQGEPWYSIAGIAVTSGVRAFILPTEPPEPFDGGPGALKAVAPPEGPLVISESWG